MHTPLKVLVVGCGNMGSSHAKAYRSIPGSSWPASSIAPPAPAGAGVRPSAASRSIDDYDRALAAAQPDCVAVCTYPDTHADLTLRAFAAGCHVFVEKPLATTVAEAEQVVAEAARSGRKLVVGYILRHHPSWLKFIELAQSLGTPLVMRMNLNQQSSGPQWATHRNLLQSMSPIVDCGVHYVDVMCLMTRSRPCGSAPSARGSPTTSRRGCTTTASSRWRSPTGRSGGTRRAGGR